MANPTERRAPQSWIDAIARGEADIAAGRVVSSEDLLRVIDERIARMPDPTLAPKAAAGR